MIDNAADKLSEKLDPYDWFCGTETKNNKIVVYTKYLNSEVMSIVPDFVDNFQVLLHFYTYLQEQEDANDEVELSTKIMN